jgi:lysophospholipase L1-like esterase
MLSIGDARAIRDVVVLDPTWSYETFQSFYLDRRRKRIKPNVVILKPPDMSVYFETNSIGFKGPQVDPSKRLAAVWGDSVVFGVGKGWVEGLGGLFQGFQFLNGGLEGDRLEGIRDRAIEGNRQTKIERNVIFPGWHSMKSGRRVRAILSELLDRLPGPILSTVPTSLSERVAGTELSPYFTARGDNKSQGDPDHDYLFWGRLGYSVRNAKKLLRQLDEQNAIVRALARARSVPLVDLHRVLYTEDLSNFREDFFDVGHPRPRSYQRIQTCFREALKDVLV